MVDRMIYFDLLDTKLTSQYEGLIWQAKKLGYRIGAISNKKFDNLPIDEYTTIPSITGVLVSNNDEKLKKWHGDKIKIGLYEGEYYDN